MSREAIQNLMFLETSFQDNFEKSERKKNQDQIEQQNSLKNLKKPKNQITKQIS